MLGLKLNHVSKRGPKCLLGYAPWQRNVGTECLCPAAVSPLYEPLDLWHLDLRRWQNSLGFTSPENQHWRSPSQSARKWSGHIHRAMSYIKSITDPALPSTNGLGTALGSGGWMYNEWYKWMCPRTRLRRMECWSPHCLMLTTPSNGTRTAS